MDQSFGVLVVSVMRRETIVIVQMRNSDFRFQRNKNFYRSDDDDAKILCRCFAW